MTIFRLSLPFLGNKVILRSPGLPQTFDSNCASHIVGLQEYCALGSKESLLVSKAVKACGIKWACLVGLHTSLGRETLRSCPLKDLSFNKQFQIWRTSNSKGCRIRKNIKFTCIQNRYTKENCEWEKSIFSFSFLGRSPQSAQYLFLTTVYNITSAFPLKSRQLHSYSDDLRYTCAHVFKAMIYP